MTNKEIGLAPYHIPTVVSGDYNITAELNQKKDNLESTIFNEGKKQEIKFSVAGYNASIPQNEVLAVYPPIDHTGNFAGTFPHIQFRRSTLPWEYEVKHGNERLPYIFLLLLKEEELKNFTIINTDTNQLVGSTESPDEPKPLKVLKANDSKLFPKADVLQKLAHVRVQEHTELKDLNLPKETSILVSHRMVEPNTKYHAFVCYYAYRSEDIILEYLPKDFITQHQNTFDQLKKENIVNYKDLKKNNLYSELVKKIEELQEEDRTNAKEFILNSDISNGNNEHAVILNEWSFESIGVELYQVASNKLKNHSDYNSFKEGLKESEIGSLEIIQNKANNKLNELINDNLKYLEERKKRWEECKKNTINKDFEKEEEGKAGNNHILEYLQHNGKNLKGYLHELELEPFKTNQYQNISGDSIQKLLNISKVPLEHQLKAGGKMVSWYQGPFTNNTSKFDLLQLLADQQIVTIPDHQDYLNLFNEETGMYDMTYSAAWQLGRLMIMNDNKVLQELKKWKYDLELYNLVLEQNKLSHLPNLSIQEPSVPCILMNYITELIQFRNFPLYYLLPHTDLSIEESIKYFKIDNSWILAFLFGIFSAGPKLSLTDFKYYLFYKPRQLCFDEFYSKLENIKSELLKINEGLVKECTNKYDQISSFYSEVKKLKEGYSVEKGMKFKELQIKVAELTEFDSVLVMVDKLSKESNNSVLKENLDKILKFKEYLHRIKTEFHYIANYHRDYYGIVLHSQTIKNWPHLVVELNESHDFHYITSINNSLRLYVTGTKISSVEMYLKNENAHFGKDYKRDDNQFIITDQDSVTTANNNLYKQPRVIFNVKDIN